MAEASPRENHLRGAYISRIERSGATVKVLQQLARHGDPKLTLNRYVRARLHDQVAAVESMANLIPKAPDRKSMKATGMENPTADPQQIPQQSQHETVQRGATRCEDDDDPKAPAANHLAIAKLSETVRRDAAPCAQYPLGDSNPCSRTENPTTGSVSAETTTSFARPYQNTSSSPSSCAQEPSKTDPDLAKLIDAWPTLPEPLKAGIRAMVDAARSFG